MALECFQNILKKKKLKNLKEFESKSFEKKTCSKSLYRDIHFRNVPNMS